MLLASRAHAYNMLLVSVLVLEVELKAIFHCSRFARAGGATNFNHVKNQSRGHAKKVECSSTSMACPRAFRRTKNAQIRQLQRKLSNVRSAHAGKATAMENCLKTLNCCRGASGGHSKDL